MQASKHVDFLPLFAGLVVAAAPAYLLRFSIFGIPTTALEILIYLFVAIVVYTQWRSFRPVPRSIVWPVALFLLAAVISTVIAPDTRAALGILKAWIFDPILFAWAFYQIPDRQRLTGQVTINFLIRGLVVGGGIVALVAIYQKLTGDVTTDGRVLGPYGWSPLENASPNYLALFLAPIGVLAAGWAAERFFARDRLTSLAAAVIFFLIVTALYLSFSRAGIGALVVGIAAKDIARFWPWIAARKLVKAALVVALIMAIVGGWFFIRPDPSLSPEEGGRITASNNVRWEIWKTTATEIIPENPLFGVGLGNFQHYFTTLTQGRINYDRIAPLALTPHNFFLSIWINLGLLGLISVVWLLIEVLRRSWRHAQNWTVAALLGSLIALLSHGLLDTPYFKNDLSLLFWTLAALLVLLTSQVDSKIKSKQATEE